MRGTFGKATFLCSERARRSMSFKAGSPTSSPALGCGGATSEAAFVHGRPHAGDFGVSEDPMHDQCHVDGSSHIPVGRDARLERFEVAHLPRVGADALEWADARECVFVRSAITRGNRVSANRDGRGRYRMVILQ